MGEYYPIGHDTPESLYDVALASSTRPITAFLYGGIGDARNLFQSLVKIAAQDRKVKENDRKHYHFTIVDIKAASIARNIVVLFLLSDLGELSGDESEMKKSNILLCVFYTYLSAIMPGQLYDMLQDTIAKAETALKEDTLPAYISK